MIVVTSNRVNHRYVNGAPLTKRHTGIGHDFPTTVSRSLRQVGLGRRKAAPENSFEVRRGQRRPLALSGYRVEGQTRSGSR